VIGGDLDSDRVAGIGEQADHPGGSPAAGGGVLELGDQAVGQQLLG